MSLHFKSVLLKRADDHLMNTQFRGQHRHLKSRGCFRQVVQVEPYTYARQIKSRHFSEQIDAQRPYFHFLYKFIGIISDEQLGQLFLKLIWIYCYLLNGIGLDQDLHNSSLVKKIADFATNNSNVWFSNTTHYLTQRNWI